MFSGLKSLFGGTAGPSAQLSPVQAAGPVYVVGDVHGALGPLEALLELIDADLAQHDMGHPHLVFLGDYVDRGEETAQVLQLIGHLAAQMPEQVVCLKGNHEAMMLDFLERPAAEGRRWMRNGGLQTLASFGVRGVTERAEGPALEAAARALEAALPAGLKDWLQALPLIWQSGNVICVHAAMDPLLPPEAQSAKTCLWGHEGFLSARGRRDGLWVAHGHTIVAQPLADHGRISVDTGAYATGVLTAAVLAPDAPLRWLQTG